MSRREARPHKATGLPEGAPSIPPPGIDREERRYAVATAPGDGHNKRWRALDRMTWTSLVEWLSLDHPADHRACGGFVLGVLHGNRRRGSNLVSRSCLTLDADRARPGLAADAALELGCALAAYTTWNSEAGGNGERWRLIAPLDRDVSPSEYRRLADAVMAALGTEQFDVRASRSAVQLMLRASSQGRYRCLVVPGDPLRVEEWLQRADETLGVPSVPGAPQRGSTAPGGPAYDDQPEAVQARLTAYTSTAVEAEIGRLDALPRPWTAGAGWDGTAYEVACNLIEFANSAWCPLDLETARGYLVAHAAIDEAWGPEKLDEKWKSALGKVGTDGRPWPLDDAGADFVDPLDEVVGNAEETDEADVLPGHGPSDLSEVALARWIARHRLAGEWLHATGLGWLQWDGTRWVARDEKHLVDAVGEVLLDLVRAATRHDVARVKEFARLPTTVRNRGLAGLIRGAAPITAEAASFDAEPDLLCVRNGVVDLRTGELLAPDPAHRLTRWTSTPYVPGARHPDWEQALTAVSPEVADWLQVRFGQAATGHTTSDDVIPLLRGRGSNGKSTLLEAVLAALGDHAAVMPDKLLRVRDGDHPTELVSLRGVRVALLDEMPNLTLDSLRLKRLVGSGTLTARRAHQDNMSWTATHSLIVASNYRPQVAEEDEGTWRRLRCVEFTRTFPLDDSFRARLVEGGDGRREAVLAWVVEGARHWYASGRKMPPAPEQVKADTEVWRRSNDLLVQFVEDRLVLDPDGMVLKHEVLEELNDWLRVQGHARWSIGLLARRLETSRTLGARVASRRIKNPEQRLTISRRFPGTPGSDLAREPRVWTGLRFAADAEGVNNEEGSEL